MIDFSTLQGLTIPEGVVTQITDANGSVLWKLATDDGDSDFYYLRPSADISVDDTITLYPAEATAAYMLLNEKVTDGASTYIGVTATDDTTNMCGTVRVTMSGDVPNISKVKSIGIYVSGDETGYISDPSGSYGSSWINIIINGTSWQLDFSVDLTGNVWGGQFKGSNYSPLKAGEYFNDVSPELLGAINDYLFANGTLPTIEMEFILNGERYLVSAKSTYTPYYGYSKISQAYIVLECVQGGENVE